MNTRVLIPIIAISFYGCATVPIGANSANPVENQYVYGGQLTPTVEKNVQITVVRDSGGTFLGLAPGIDVYCDSVKVVKLERPSDKFTFYVTPGPHFFKVVYVAPPPDSTERTGNISGLTLIGSPKHAIVLQTGVTPGEEPLRIIESDDSPSY